MIRAVSHYPYTTVPIMNPLPEAWAGIPRTTSVECCCKGRRRSLSLLSGQPSSSPHACESYACRICSYRRVWADLHWAVRLFELADMLWWSTFEWDKRATDRLGKRRQRERGGGWLLVRRFSGFGPSHVFAMNDLGGRGDPESGAWLDSGSAFELFRTEAMVLPGAMKVTGAGIWRGRERAGCEDEGRPRFVNLGVHSDEVWDEAWELAGDAAERRFGARPDEHSLPPGLVPADWAEMVREALDTVHWRRGFGVVGGDE